MAIMRRRSGVRKWYALGPVPKMTLLYNSESLRQMGRSSVARVLNQPGVFWKKRGIP
jgi:hypothetical protein